MATEKIIRRVWNTSTGSPYRAGTDWTDDGDGTVTVVPGSGLDDDGGTGSLDYIEFSNSAPGTNITMKVDSAYSGVRKVSSPSQSFGAGTSINVHAPSIHVNEHIDGNQTNTTFSAYAADSGAQSLVVDDYVCMRLGSVDLSGTVIGRSEWYFKIIQRDAEQDSNNQRYYRYLAADLSEDIRGADVSAIPRKAVADTISYPGDTGGPPMTSIVGQRAFTLRELLSAVKPAYATILLNAPDVILETMPEEGDGLDLLNAALKATGYYMRWEGVTLHIEQHEPVEHQLSLAITDSQCFECKTELGRGAAYDSVRIERAPRIPVMGTGLPRPDVDRAPTGQGGSGILPAEADTVARLGGDATIWSANFTAVPPQAYVDAEPGDIMLGFSDTAYNNSGYTGQQLAHLLQFLPQQCTIEPPTRWTRNQVVNGPSGTDWYFLFKWDYDKVQSSNLDYVEGFVVARNGYYADTGAINRNQNPVPNATVVLVGETTGIVLESTTTNSEGYYRVETGGNRDRWLASVYVDGDAYQANKEDIYTAGHPFDDDPANDGLGPDNRTEQQDLWRVRDTKVRCSVVYRTNRTVPDEPLTETGALFESYRGEGGFYWGDEAVASTQVIDPADLDIDPANITSDVQAGLLAEKLIDRSTEEQQVYVVTKPCTGDMTAPGRCVALRIAADGGLTANCRIITREIQVTDTGIMEVLSSADDTFVNETDRRFAKKSSTEVRIRQLVRNQQEFVSQLLQQAGILSEVYGNGVR